MAPAHPVPDVPAALTAIISQLQLVQRRLLRVDGLTTLEHTLLLGTVAELLVIAQRLQQQIAPGPAPTETGDPHAPGTRCCGCRVATT